MRYFPQLINHLILSFYSVDHHDLNLMIDIVKLVSVNNGLNEQHLILMYFIQGTSPASDFFFILRLSFKTSSLLGLDKLLDNVWLAHMLVKAVPFMDINEGLSPSIIIRFSQLHVEIMDLFLHQHLFVDCSNCPSFYFGLKNSEFVLDS